MSNQVKQSDISIIIALLCLILMDIGIVPIIWMIAASANLLLALLYAVREWKDD